MLFDSIKVGFVSCCLLMTPSALANEYQSCGLTKKARELAKLIVEDEAQQRELMICDSLLAKVASAKAKEMAKLNKVSHYGPGGTPNQRLIKAGYPLKHYDNSDNNVEAVLGGESDPAETLLKFQTSYAHRVHLFAEHDFFKKQSKIGVGYFRDSSTDYVDFWVVYIAE